MRKYILPLLVAGAVAFTATQAMATANTEMGEFTEEHATDKMGNPTDHYKVTDVMEMGGHGKGVGGFQLSSAILKSLAAFDFEGDDSYGYVTGSNPFTQGAAGTGSPGGETDEPMEVPEYTLPCPEWVASGPEGAKLGTCDANDYATDPQTEDPNGTWDGVVLDDLYQRIGSDGTSTSTFTEGSEVWSVKKVRFIDQTLDALFYNGKRGIITLGTGPALEGSGDGVVDSGRHFNIDQTLDQDLADYSHEYEGTTVGAPLHETMGIFGKITQLFQLAAKASTLSYSNGASTWTNSGCASGGALDESDSLTGNQCSGATATWDGAEWAEYWEDQGDELSTFLVDQWIVAEMYDWHPYNGSDADLSDKYAGRGVIQEYSSWFRDGANKDWTYSYTYPGGHGKIDKTVTGLDHGGIDP